MSAQAIETYWYDGEWHNRRQGEPEPIASFDTKEYAKAVGRQRAMDNRVEHIVKDVDGSIEERTLYGNPPRQRKTRTARSRSGNNPHHARWH